MWERQLETQDWNSGRLVDLVGGHVIVAERRRERLFISLPPSHLELKTCSFPVYCYHQYFLVTATSIFSSWIIMTQEALPGGLQVPQRVWVGGITAEQEVGGPWVTDRTSFGHCGDKSTRWAYQVPWDQRTIEKRDALPTTSPAPSTQLPTPELPQFSADAAAEPTPLPLKHGDRPSHGGVGEGGLTGIADWSEVRSQARWLVLRVMGGKSLRLKEEESGHYQRADGSVGLWRSLSSFPWYGGEGPVMLVSFKPSVLKLLCCCYRHGRRLCGIRYYFEAKLILSFHL